MAHGDKLGRYIIHTTEPSVKEGLRITCLSPELGGSENTTEGVSPNQGSKRRIDRRSYYAM